MTNKKPWSIFDPLPGKDINLGTGFEEEAVKSGKTSERVHKDVFGDLNDEGLFDDIFGVSYDDVTLKNRKKKHGQT